MLITPKQLAVFWGLNRPDRIVHVGAHKAEELEMYMACGWGSESTVWVEALPDQVAFVRQKIDSLRNQEVIQAVAWERTGEEVTFSLASNGESSSALEFAEHLSTHPEISVLEKFTMETTALKDLDIWGVSRSVFLNLDVQGAELSALKGMGHHIEKCVAIYTEVNTRELYRGVPLIDEMDSFLNSSGFSRVDEQLFDEFGWGDALYLPSDSIPAFVTFRRQARKLFKRTTNFGRLLGQRARAR